MVRTENNHLMNVLFSCTDTFVLFLSAWIIFSLWAGYSIGITWLVPLAAIFFVLVLYHFRVNWLHASESLGPFSNHSLHGIVVLSLATVGVLGYIFFVMQGGFDLSADAAPSVAAYFIQSTIPATYAPYFDLPFFYQPGVPLLTTQLESSLGLSFHVGGWFFGVVGIILILLSCVRISVWASGKKESLFFVLAFFVGARLIFVDLLVGEYPLLLGLGLALTALHAMHNRPVLSAILFSGAGIVHPYAAGILFVFALFLHRPSISTILRISIIGLVCVLPLSLYMFVPVLLAGGSSSLSGEISLESFFRTISPLVIFLGVAPLLSIIGSSMIAPDAIKNSTFVRRIGMLAAGGVFLYIIFANTFPVLLLHSKFLEAGALFIIIFAAALLSLAIPTRAIVPVLVAVLLIGLSINFTSNDLSRLANGSKTGIREASFSEWFGRMEPFAERTIFFARGPGKMAQYSNKIPVDAKSANFTLSLHLFSRSTRAQHYLSETAVVSDAVKTGCFSCVESIPYTYLVVDTRSFALPEGMVPEYWHDEFAVFKKQ